MTGGGRGGRAMWTDRMIVSCSVPTTRRRLQSSKACDRITSRDGSNAGVPGASGQLGAEADAGSGDGSNGSGAGVRERRRGVV